MNVLIAEDSAVSRRVLEATLQKWGYEVTVTIDGDEAWAALQPDDAPRLVVLDWMMPGMDGTEICQRLREREDGESFYILLLTARAEQDDVVQGLHSGADDYIAKPFHHDELRARMRIAQRMIDLQGKLERRIGDLEAALREVDELTGLLPLCCYCRKIRNDRAYWDAVEQYIAEHPRVKVSHGICPDCYEKEVKPQLDDFAPGK